MKGLSTLGRKKKNTMQPKNLQIHPISYLRYVKCWVTDCTRARSRPTIFHSEEVTDFSYNTLGDFLPSAVHHPVHIARASTDNALHKAVLLPNKCKLLLWFCPFAGHVTKLVDWCYMAVIFHLHKSSSFMQMENDSHIIQRIVFKPLLYVALMTLCSNHGGVFWYESSEHLD